MIETEIPSRNSSQRTEFQAILEEWPFDFKGGRK